jgi:hypothetical protein
LATGGSIPASSFAGIDPLFLVAGHSELILHGGRKVDRLRPPAFPETCSRQRQQIGNLLETPVQSTGRRNTIE